MTFPAAGLSRRSFMGAGLKSFAAAPLLPSATAFSISAPIE